MKTKLITTGFIIMILGALLPFTVGARQAEDPGVLLRAAMEKEEVDGDLQGAIDLYKQIIEKYSSNHTIAARAQLHIGMCYEKLGLVEAQKAYQKVIENYPGQTEAVKVAKEKLDKLLKAQAVVEKGEEGFKITKMPMEAYGAFISPDGKKLACIKEQGDVWVRDIVNGKETRLTNTPRYDYWCFWSFDSKMIAHLDAHGGLHVVSADGGQPKTLIEAESDLLKGGNYVWPVSWTSDNQMLICHVSSRGLCAIPISGGEWKDIFKFTDPGQEKDYGLLSLSPNGRLIAYQSKKAGNDDIYVMPADGGESIQITHHPGPDLFPKWSFDGRWLAFETLRTGEREIWVVKIAPDGEPEAEPFRVVEAVDPNVSGATYNWTADEKLGISVTRSYSNIFVVDPESKEETQLTNSLSWNGVPRWSRNGSHIAFVSDRGGKRNIWTVPSSGGEPRLVTGNITHPSFFLYMHSAAWSPDGKNIAFGIYYSNEGDKGIWVIPGEEGPIKKINFGYDGSIQGIDWSPDGRQIAFSYSREITHENPIPDSRVGFQDVYIISADGGEPTKVTKTDNERLDFRNPRWSPDGKKIATFGLDFSWNGEETGESGIYIVDLESGRMELNPESDKGMWRGLSWSPDEKNFVLSRWLEDRMYLHTVSFRGGEINNLNIEGLEPDYSPDGKKIVFARRTGASKEFWIVENFLPKLEEKK
jgi:Tol biopolymer transport system component